MSTFWRLQLDMPGKRPKFTHICVLFTIISFTYFTCFKFNLKSDNDLQFTKSAGSEFHSVINLGKRKT